MAKRNTLTKIQLYLILFICVVKNNEGKVSSGYLATSEKWKFLDRFCFLSLYGQLEYEIEYDAKYGAVSLLMYPDIQWDDAYKSPKAKTCQEKNNVLIKSKKQILLLDLEELEAGCEQVYHPKLPPGPNQETKQNFTTRILCKSIRAFSTVRERWWFIGVSSCNSTQGLNLRYDFRMTNGRPSDYWYEHFSADEFYILPVLTAFCFIYLFLLFTALVFAVELKCRQLFHITYKLFLTSLGFQNIGIILLCVAYGRYASNGVGLPTIKLFGRIFESLSEFVFILLLLLLAKGFTVTRGRLRLASAIKLTIFLCSYFVIYCVLFLHEQYVFDPGMVLYIYESPAGYGILILRIVGWVMFVYAIFFTLKHYPEKASFYLPFFGVYSLWFISGPVVIIISNHVIDKWVREKVSISVEHACIFIGHVVFLCLTRPSAANKSFPYHVRTTQVGAEFNGSTEPLDRFEAHSYAPSYIDPAGRTVDIFTVTGVLQRLDGANHPVVNSSPMDVFSVAGGVSPSIPAMFPLPPPKYEDEFPHETPGQVAEMLKEPEYTDSEEEDSTNMDTPRKSKGLELEDVQDSPPVAIASISNGSAIPPGRESVYVKNY